MALLIVNLDRQIGNAQLWRDTFAEQMPGLEIRVWPDLLLAILFQQEQIPRIAHRQRLQKQFVHQTEYQGVRADADGEQQNHDSAEETVTPHLPQTVEEIAPYPAHRYSA